MRLLCLSNGHGEDIIAVRILQELQQNSDNLELAALPLVGEGHAYAHLNIPLIGPVQTMPSGGFIYMDGRQMVRDMQGGLLQLTWKQIKAIRKWSKKGGAILAVGDIVPLLFAWLSSLPYAFVGTAKSEYYIRDENGPLKRQTRAQRWEGWSGSVYLPWERWLMSRKRCRAVFPRDSLTTETLLHWAIPAFDLGNPMMDGIGVEASPLSMFSSESQAELEEQQRSLKLVLLPGSRPPEAYANWELILSAVAGLIAAFPNLSLVFLAAVAPGLALDTLRQVLETHNWHQETEGSLLENELNPESKIVSDSEALGFRQKKATLVLTQNAYSECLNLADFAIATAGTATEQFVGLGKPAIAFPGSGPQYNPVFAEAQSRLLGPSLILVEQPSQVANVIQFLLKDPDRLQLIAENGHRRMGQPGAARRIARCLSEKLL